MTPRQGNTPQPERDPAARGLARAYLRLANALAEEESETASPAQPERHPLCGEPTESHPHDRPKK